MAHVRDRYLRGLAGGVGVGLVLQQIHIAGGTPFPVAGNHDGADHRAEGGLQLLKNLVKISIFIVDLVDEEEGGDALFGGPRGTLFPPPR